MKISFMLFYILLQTTSCLFGFTGPSLGGVDVSKVLTNDAYKQLLADRDERVCNTVDSKLESNRLYSAEEINTLAYAALHHMKQTDLEKFDVFAQQALLLDDYVVMTKSQFMTMTIGTVVAMGVLYLFCKS